MTTAEIPTIHAYPVVTHGHYLLIKPERRGHPRMLKRFVRGFLTFSFVALAVVLAAWGATYSPSYRKCVSDHTGDARSNKTSNLNEAITSSPQIVPVFLLCEGTFIDENNGTLTV